MKKAGCHILETGFESHSQEILNNIKKGITVAGAEQYIKNARKAGLNPEDFWLHKFRATFATTHLRAGVDLKTVMAWMGQTTMDSIIRYLKPARRDEVINKVNSSFTGPTFANRKRINSQSLAVG